MSVLEQLVARCADEGLSEFETLSQRTAAVARAVTALAKVEHDRWSQWSPDRLRRLTDNELADYLAEEEAKRLHAQGPIQ